MMLRRTMVVNFKPVATYLFDLITRVGTLPALSAVFG